MNLIFDGHLDIAMNALGYERDQCQPVEAIRRFEMNAVDDGRDTATTSLATMRSAGIAVCLATIITRCKDVKPERGPIRRHLDYPTQDMAHAAAVSHLAYYELLERRGEVAILRRAASICRLASFSPWRVPTRSLTQQNCHGGTHAVFAR